MKKFKTEEIKKLKLKDWIFIGIISVISILAIRLNSRPNVYMGFVFALIGILFVGFYSNRILAPIIAILITLFGFLIRWHFPLKETLKGAKLQAYLQKNQQYHDFISKYLILILLAIGLLAFIAGICGEILREDRKLPITVNKITYMALFIAIGVIINSVRIGDISFGGLPIIFSGFILGPIGGFLVGGATDLLAFLVRPSASEFNLLFTFTSALTGLIPIMVVSLLGDEYPKYKFWKILVGIFVGQILTSVVLVPIFQTMLYAQNSFWVYFMKALVKQLLSIPFYAFLVFTINDRVSKVLGVKKWDAIR